MVSTESPQYHCFIITVLWEQLNALHKLVFLAVTINPYNDIYYGAGIVIQLSDEIP